MLPMAFTVTSDAYVALKRIATLLLATDLPSKIIIEPSQSKAISAYGDFIWETVSSAGGGVMGGKGAGGGGQGRGGRDYEAIKKKKKEEKERKKINKERRKKGLEPLESEEEMKKRKGKEGGEKEPFSLRGIELEVERGALVCIVGSVGSGKVIIPRYSLYASPGSCSHLPL